MGAIKRNAFMAIHAALFTLAAICAAPADAAKKAAPGKTAVASNADLNLPTKKCNDFKNCFPGCERAETDPENKSATEPFHMQAVKSGKAPYRGTIVLVHGLSDSPYSFGSIAEAYRKQGYNVIVPLLPGHGKEADDASRLNPALWKKTVDDAMASAQKKYPGKVCIGGFSTGGALAVDYMLRAKKSDSMRQADCAMLWDPALAIPKMDELKARAGNLAINVLPKKAGEKLEQAVLGKEGDVESPAHSRMRAQGIKALLDVQRGINKEIADGAKIDVKTMTFYSTGKTTANSKVKEKMGSLYESEDNADGGTYDSSHAGFTSPKQQGKCTTKGEILGMEQGQQMREKASEFMKQFDHQPGEATAAKKVQ